MARSRPHRGPSRAQASGRSDRTAADRNLTEIASECHVSGRYIQIARDFRRSTNLEIEISQRLNLNVTFGIFRSREIDRDGFETFEDRRPLLRFIEGAEQPLRPVHVCFIRHKLSFRDTWLQGRGGADQPLRPVHVRSSVTQVAFPGHTHTTNKTPLYPLHHDNYSTYMSPCTVLFSGFACSYCRCKVSV